LSVVVNVGIPENLNEVDWDSYVQFTIQALPSGVDSFVTTTVPYGEDYSTEHQ
jgi:hypothetical protein